MLLETEGAQSQKGFDPSWSQREHGWIDVGRGALVGKMDNSTLVVQPEKGVVIPFTIRLFGDKALAQLPDGDPDNDIDTLVANYRGRYYRLLFKLGGTVFTLLT
jgi:hypothetical protein